MIFIFDIDGTLTDVKDHQIVLSAKYTLKQLQKNHTICVASGRAYYKTKKFCDENEIDTFVANGGNSLCYQGKKIYNESLPLDLCLQLLEEVERLGYGYLLALEDNIDVVMKNTLFLKQMGERKEPTRYFLRPDLDLYTIKHIYKIYISIPIEEEYRLTTLSKITHLRFSGDYLMIQPDNKKNGIYHLLDYLQASKEEVVVFGDDVNDLDMFDESWLKIAMGNGHPALKAKADYITDSNIQDGILKACRHFHWIDE